MFVPSFSKLMAHMNAPQGIGEVPAVIVGIIAAYLSMVDVLHLEGASTGMRQSVYNGVAELDFAIKVNDAAFIVTVAKFNNLNKLNLGGCNNRRRTRR